MSTTQLNHATLHRRFVELAILKGETPPDHVLSMYPGIVEHVQRAIVPNLYENRPPRQPRRRPQIPKPEPLTEPWLRFEGPSIGDLLEQIDFAGGQLVTGDHAQAFVEDPDAAELFKGARIHALDRGFSKKLAVLLVPGGSHVIISTAYSNGEGDLAPKVTLPTAWGGKGGFAFKFVPGMGYQLIACLKMKEPTKAHLLTYPLTDWLRAADELRSMKAAAQRTAVAVGDQLRNAGWNRQDDRPGLDDGCPDFDSGLAAALYSLLRALSAEKGHPVSPNLVRLALTRIADTGGRNAQALGRLLLAMKADGLSYDDSVTKLEDRLLQAHHESRSSAEFVEALGKTETRPGWSDAGLGEQMDDRQTDCGWTHAA